MGFFPDMILDRKNHMSLAYLFFNVSLIKTLENVHVVRSTLRGKLTNCMTHCIIEIYIQ